MFRSQEVIFEPRSSCFRKVYLYKVKVLISVCMCIYIYIHTVLDKKKSPLGFLAITRYHSIGEVPESVEMVPISHPELPKPSRTSGKNQKPIC